MLSVLSMATIALLPYFHIYTEYNPVRFHWQSYDI